MMITNIRSIPYKCLENGFINENMLIKWKDASKILRFCRAWDIGLHLHVLTVHPTKLASEIFHKLSPRR